MKANGYDAMCLSYYIEECIMIILRFCNRVSVLYSIDLLGIPRSLDIAMYLKGKGIEKILCKNEILALLVK